MLFSPKNHVTLPLNFQQVGITLNKWPRFTTYFLGAFLIEGFIYDFKIAGFSLSSWKINNGFNEEDRLPVHTAAKVHDLLKIPFYRLSSSCSRSLAPYAPTYIGWVECKSDSLTEMFCGKKINASYFPSFKFPYAQFLITPELKAQVSFSDHVSSSVCLSVCKLFIHIFNFFSKTT